MKILAFSDWRVQDLDFPVKVARKVQPDIVLYAGDDVERLADGGRKSTFGRLSEHSRCGVAAVLGNDCLPQHRSLLRRASVHDLHSSPMNIPGWSILGLEGGTNEVDLPIGLIINDGRHIRSHLQSQKESVDSDKTILVSHVPPFGILDVGARFGVAHKGSPAVREFIERTGPALCVCGHVHLAGGRSQSLDETTVINVASMDRNGDLGRMAEIEVKDGVVTDIHWITPGDSSFGELESLYLVGPARADFIRELGIRDVSSLQGTRERALLAYHFPWKLVYKWLGQVDMRMNGIPYELEKPLTTPEDIIYYDIETNLRRSNTWLIGAYHPVTDRFRQWFQPDPRLQPSMWKNFLDWVRELGCENLASWGPYDRSVMGQQISSCLPNHQTLWFGQWKHMDLKSKVSECALFARHGYSLKDVATTLGYRFQHPDIGGLEVGDLYQRYLQIGESPNWDRLREYNQDDVLAMDHVVRSLATE